MLKALACRVTVTVMVLPPCATVPDPTVGEEKPVRILLIANEFLPLVKACALGAAESASPTRSRLRHETSIFFVCIARGSGEC